VQSIFQHARLAIVDLETTGTVATVDRITEIGILRIEHGEVVETWSSLVNPGVPIPPEIQSLTGITDAMVRAAPTFSALREAILSRLDDHLFIAHNARFDYAFLKNELRRIGVRYTADVLCTVRLSRKLYPQYATHGLDALIERHGLAHEGRHRAIGDAVLTWRFIETALREHPREDVTAAVRSILNLPSLPSQLAPDALANLPDGPGVYLFYGVNDLPIYIGKSVNLRNRVRAHFSSDHRNANDVRLSMEIRRLTFEETAGEFGALLREAELVKRMMPLHNLRLRRHAQLVLLRLTDMAQPIEWVPLNAVDLGDANATRGLFGPFRTRASAKAHLLALAAEHALCWKALGAQSTKGACFARQIHRCRGYCEGAETLAAHNARLVEALRGSEFPAWPFDGAMAIRETHPEHGWQRWHAFNQWRYLGTANTESDVPGIAAIAGTREFDVDVFRLLAKRLASEKRAPRNDVLEISELS
jgi:DNA polymerase III subunit epsilon